MCLLLGGQGGDRDPQKAPGRGAQPAREVQKKKEEKRTKLDPFYDLLVLKKGSGCHSFLLQRAGRVP